MNNQVFKITNLWIQVNIESDSQDFWYIDYENGEAKKSPEKPKNESIRKWKGSITNFLEQRGTKVLEEADILIKFKPEKTPQLFHKIRS